MSSALPITVVNGNLRFVREPLVLGHYRSMALTGTEWVMDNLIGGTMRDSLAIGRYPDAVGSQQIFLNGRANPTNPLQLPRPAAVIVVGLGEEGKLRAADLALAVRQGAMAWAQRALEESPRSRRDTVPPAFRLAATLIGSGGIGMSAGQSACLVAQGVRDANERLRQSKWPTVEALQLIELYHDRATEAWAALRALEVSSPGTFAVHHEIQPGVGGLPRPLDSGYRGAEYDLISAVSQQRDDGAETISYTIDTRRARAEVRAQAVQQTLLRELVASASNHESKDRSVGRTLFQLLVPVEMEAFLGGSSAALLEVDRGTAGIPWELLDTEERAGGNGQHKPWALRAKVLRRLRTAEFRAITSDANAESSVLIIGEPACDTSCYPRLPGARAEAHAVVQIFEGHDGDVAKTLKALVSPDDSSAQGADARTVINTLLDRDWRVVHIAGHGEPPEQPAAGATAESNALNPRGVVLSNGTYLGSREIRSMRVVPELVFVNCCHLAARDGAGLLRADGSPPSQSYDRSRFAANVSEELIMLGVRCVVAAGWAIEDEPARLFATTFYSALLQGERFIDAVNRARIIAHAQGGNTWAAYQCYGDPDWRLVRPGANSAAVVTAPKRTFANVASASALRLVLETLAVNAQFDSADLSADREAPRDVLRGQLESLEKSFGDTWGDLGAVAEAFGKAWGEAGDEAEAIRWYQRAMRAEDGGASMLAAEQASNLRVRQAWSSVRRAQHEREVPPTGAAKKTTSTKAKRRKSSFDETLAAARTEVDDSIAALEKLAAIGATAEREALLGSAWKRKAQLELVAGDTKAAQAAMLQMRARYRQADALSWQAKPSSRHYPALNIISAEMAMHGGDAKWKGLDAGEVAKVRDSLAAKASDDPDFWSVVGLTELHLYQAAASGTVAAEQAAIEEEFADLYRRVSAQRYWRSVHEQAQFVLVPREARMKAAERKATAALLELLERYASGT